METAIVHDYLTQRGGAERVVLSMLEALPDAPLYTSVFEPSRTFPEFARHDVRTTALNSFYPFRRWHRVALPVLAPVFSRLHVRADVVVCSSSGWAHGVAAEGRKVVYCHSPARWLYQTSRYVGGSRGLSALANVMRRPLEEWDRRAAATAARYVVNSTAVRERVRELYGIDAEVLAPPPALIPEGTVEKMPAIEPGFILCVSRLLPYKNVDAVAEAFARLPEARLVVVGSGPERDRLVAAAPPNVTFLQSISDAQLRWLYASSAGTVAASYEDFGLTPLEAASFGKPSAVLHWGGFRDTVVEGETGIFFDEPTPQAIAAALDQLQATDWDERALVARAASFSEERFVRRLREIVAEEAGR